MDLSKNLKNSASRRNAFRLLFGLLLALSVMQLAACSYSAPNTPTASGDTTVNGTVNSVSLTTVLNSSGGTQPATSVVLTVPLGTNSLVLCGDQRTSFTLNASVNVSYTNGVYCSTLVSVTPH